MISITMQSFIIKLCAVVAAVACAYFNQPWVALGCLAIAWWE